MAEQTGVTDNDRRILNEMRAWQRNFTVSGPGVTFHNTATGCSLFIGRRDAPPAAPSWEMRYGVVQTTWTEGNTVSVKRCRNATDSTLVNASAAAFNVYLFFPLDYTVPAGPWKIEANKIIGYWPIDDGASVEAGKFVGSLPINVETCT